MINDNIIWLISKYINCNVTMIHYLEFLRQEGNYNHIISLLMKIKTPCMETIIKYNYKELFDVLITKCDMRKEIDIIDCCIRYKNKDILKSILKKNNNDEHISTLINPLLNIIEHHLYLVIPECETMNIDLRSIIVNVSGQNWYLIIDTLSHYLLRYIDLPDSLSSLSDNTGYEFVRLVYQSINRILTKELEMSESELRLIGYMESHPHLIQSHPPSYHNVSILYYFLFNANGFAMEEFITPFINHTFFKIYTTIGERINAHHPFILHSNVLPYINIPYSYIKNIREKCCI